MRAGSLQLTEARSLVERSREPEITPEISRGIMEMITTILVYKFTNLSRREVESMLSDTMQQSRLYREIKEEGQQEGQRSLVLLQLDQKFGTLPTQIGEQIESLDFEQLQSLAIALLDFTSIDDLIEWLDR